jgi:hypothetical protein
MNLVSWLLSPSQPEDMCSASWQPFLLSLSPAVCALLSAIALWVASRARTTSVAAQQTSQAAQTLWLLGSGSQPATGRHEAEQDPPKP